jgi:DNA polymerase-3 subunit epsilon
MGWALRAHELQQTPGGCTCTVCGRYWGATPVSPCPGVKVYQWGKWPEHLLTKLQLNAAGFSTSPKLLPDPAGAVLRTKSPDGLMFLYDRNTATPKRVLSEEEKAKRAEVTKRLRAAWHCRRCNRRVEKCRYGTGWCETCFDHIQAAAWAFNLIGRPDDYVILDTETSGLNAGYNEIVELAVIDGHGRTLLDTRINPVDPLKVYEGERMCAFDVHGISAEMLTDAPRFPTVYLKLRLLLKNKLVLIYNASYDTGMLVGDCDRHRLPRLKARRWLDVMVPYAEFCGQRRYDGDYRWQKLEGGHSALSDCLAVQRVLHEMAKEMCSEK